MKNYRRMALHPTRYQGWGQSRRYFEGWYFKLVDPELDVAYAIIPGVSMGEDGEQHAFIQVLDGVAATSSYHRFAFEEFQAKKDRFAVSIGENHFSADELELNLSDLKMKVTNKVAVPWPSRRAAPGVMGWYGYVPGMQCYHGLVSLHHRLEGWLEDQNGKRAFSKQAVGYIEKDWGKSFPNAWVWLQSNHLNHPAPNSLMVSVADIPWLGTSFVGFLSTFLFDGELHTLATWTGAKAKLHFKANQVTIELSDKKRLLRVTGRPGAGGDLASPIQGAMTGKINESLRAELAVSFRYRGELLYEGEAGWAGLEVTDNAEKALAGIG
ncbi:hypothetical protein CEQ90_01425 [Lewinellaceae bacterium SD302]|nr:hypothetical protein CEQ90_01425 [Lewinellaceae bacterium SD302]